MSTQMRRQFLWTAIPAGRAVPLTEGTEHMALLSVLLTPRLIGPEDSALTVARFGMQSWPQRLAALRFDVFRGEQLVPARRVPHTTAAGQEITFSVAEQLAAWQGLFPGNTPVRPYHPASYDGRTVREFPATEAAADVRRVYTDTARAHLAHDGETPEDSPALRTALRQVREGWQSGLWPPSDGPASTSSTSARGSALARAYAFYRRDPSECTPLTPQSEAIDAREFHGIVARLADHPVLLRVLGLVVDLAVPAAQLTQGDLKELRVVPRRPDPDTSPPAGWGNAAQQDLSPKTAYHLEGRRFVPASFPRPGATEFKRGLLPLKDAGVAPSANARYEVMPFDVDGAALRMVGAAASDRDRPPARDAPAAAQALPALRSMGFALIERDREQEHHKQLQRAKQRATQDGLLGSPLSADSLLGGYRVDIQDAETGRWYSLCRRRVRYTIGGVAMGQDVSGGARGFLEEGYVRPGAATTGAGAEDTLYVHQAVARWDGWSLVAQRPERTVDTGDEVPQVAAPPFEAVVECEPGSLPRLRFGNEYRLRVRIADLAGGGLRGDETGPAEEQTKVFTHHRYEPLPPPELLPTRVLSDGETQDLMVIRSDRGTSVGAYAAAHGYRPFDLRHLIAPACALEVAMQHEGRFDGALGAGVPAAEVNRLFEIAKRADRDVRDIPGVTILGDGAAPSASAGYAVLPEGGVTVPWLADPGGTHIALNARPRPIDPDTGDHGTVTGLPKIAVWRGEWPGLHSIALRLEAAANGCTVTRSADHRTLTVALGPAEQVTFDIPSCPKTRNVQLFGIAGWLGVDVTDPATFQHIVQGHNRLITPPRTVTLVHAVQRPLRDPGGRLTAQRNAGDTGAVLRTEGLLIDVPSTGRIDVRAEWTDHEDVRPGPPGEREKKAAVGSYDVRHVPLFQALGTIRQEFGDTRRRHVSYTVTGVSRFQDCFPRATAADPGACLATGVLQTTDVPSSARPPAPELLYTVPTFRWSRTVDGQRSTTRRRHGGGLRVFLERPWYVSGDEEALALLTWPAPSAPADTLRHLSVAGRDPIWSTGSPPGVLTQDHVNAPLGDRADLPELQRTLGVSAFPVRFDEEADRWYADLDLSPVVSGSYFPFVRLALARYQPHTVPGVANLSPAVQTEPIQLPPHRQLVVTRTTGRATVAVDGLGPSGPKTNVIRTELQVRDAPEGNPDAAAGWTTIFRTASVLGQVRDVDIPHSGERPLRLVVQEFETHPPATSESGTAIDGTGRLVYADIVPLGQW
ncbi:hypothetical protein QWM81_17580 [Streptomyces ficellus]|uniref:Baseplate protein J-like domain-containing protein n=1 Tax=Streptomyces ficellus TaxID=1977088 RepID=A0ABT7Z8I6_9ACTN|nr:hypothetical protein [Streptomyces ficellus]MDN3295828.1 hypothetical protein [Streptomyces ficellus]